VQAYLIECPGLNLPTATVPEIIRTIVPELP
jgi:hypothetical protein